MPIQNPADDDQQQSAFNSNQSQNKFNKFRGLQGMFQQNQGTSMGAVNTNKTNATKGVAQAQNQASAYTVGQGQDASQKVGAAQGAFVIPSTVQAAPTYEEDDRGNMVEVKKQGVTELGSWKGRADHGAGADLFYRLNEAGKLGDTNAFQNLTPEQIAEWQRVAASDIAKADEQLLAQVQKKNDEIAALGLSDTQALNSAAAEQQAILSGMPTANLAEIGVTGAVEDEAQQLNQLFSGALPTSNLAGLSALYGANYDTGRYGGLDSQLQQGRLQGMRGEANENLDKMRSAQSLKGASVKDYHDTLKRSKEGIDMFTQGKTADIARATQERKDALAKEEARARGEITAEGEKVGEKFKKLSGYLESNKTAKADRDAKSAKAKAEQDEYKKTKQTATNLGVATANLTHKELKDAIKKKEAEKKKTAPVIGSSKFKVGKWG